MQFYAKFGLICNKIIGIKFSLNFIEDRSNQRFIRSMPKGIVLSFNSLEIQFCPFTRGKINNYEFRDVGKRQLQNYEYDFVTL